MDILQIYHDFNITYRTEGHKHCRPGWVNVECPFCTGNPGYHLGIPIGGDFFQCWRCGSHPPRQTIAKLLKISEVEAAKIIREYKGYAVSKNSNPKVSIRKKAHKFPSNTSLLTVSHKKYLRNRGFDPDQLEKDWHLLSTGPISVLDNLNFNHRILIPVYWEGKQVTYQARDVTGRSKIKYMDCPGDRELINIKHIIYGQPKYWGETGICVEGVTDVWRLGPYSFCTFGIKFTRQQVRVIAKAFKRVAVVYDGEPQAQEQARLLIAELRFRGIDAWNVLIEGDPGAMTQKDANALVSSILENNL